MEAVLCIGIRATGKSSFYLSAGKTPLVADIVYRSIVHKARMLQIGMAQGMNMAQYRLPDIASKLK